MADAQVIQVIKTTLTVRGNGQTDPFRSVTQYWSLDGVLLAEVDPCPSKLLFQFPDVLAQETEKEQA